MGRRLRQSWAGGLFHVMNRGVARQPVFFDDSDRVEFGRRLAALHVDFGVETVAYCLMTNHYHLLLRPTAGRLSDAMQHLGSVYTRHTNARIGRDGPLFRGRFASVPVTSDAQLFRTVRYVHRNALDLPGVSKVERYRWSSLRAYLGLRRVPSFVNVDLVLGVWTSQAAFLAAHYDEPETVELASVAELDELIGHQLTIEALGRPGPESPLSMGVVRTLVIDRGRESVKRFADEVFATSSARYSAVSRARAKATAEPRIDRVVADVLAIAV